MANGFVINARSLNRRLSGVERYTAEVTKRLAGQPRFVAPGKVVPPLLGHVWEQVVLPWKLNKGELLWSPANIGPLAVSDQVLTLHDLSVLEHPEWFQPLYAHWYQFALPRLVRQVRRVLTVSEYSRQRIIQSFGISPEKVVTIPAGVDSKHFRPVEIEEAKPIKERYGLANDYVLLVGTLEPRKNFSLLFEVWKLIHSKFPHVEIVIAGGSAPHFAALPPIPDGLAVRFLGYVLENDLPALYSAAIVFLLPSIEEGFGLTALEAMACGTPVVAAMAGALPETVGAAGVLIDPRDTLGWADALCRLLVDRDYRHELKLRGRERAQNYSWENTASRVGLSLETA